MARSDLLAPMHRLADDAFVGRTEELGQLRSYVFEQAPSRLGIRLFGSRPEAPLFVYGPGGVGKSTLLARFILDHAGDATVRLAYIDIDRPTIRPNRPATLLIDVISQLQPQLDGRSGDLGILANELAYSTGREEEGRRSESAPSDDDSQLARFSAVLRPLVANSVLLVVIDTFEEAQFLGYEVVWSLTRFLLRLAGALPNVRLLLSGRALPPEFLLLAFPRLSREPGPDDQDSKLLEQLPMPVRPINLGVLDEPTARDLLRHLTLQAGLPALPDAALNNVIAVVSPNPMCLRLAARLLADGGADQLLQSRSEFLTRLRAEKIQALLYGRILGNLHADDVRAVAVPGLVVRRITPDVIREVLAEPCGLKLTPERDEGVIFRELRDEAALLQVDPEDGSLRHRADVRRAMLEDLTDQVAADVVEQIDRAAVTFYEKGFDYISRAEEIYHRLRLRDPVEILEARWIPEVADRLKNVGVELPAPQRLWLAGKLGITLEESVRRTADQDAWEDQAARSADRFLESNDPDLALHVLHERRARLPRSKLYSLEAEAYRLAGQPDEALQVARAGVTALSKAGAIDMALELVLQMAAIEEGRGNLSSAARLAEEADGIAQHSADEVLRLRVMITGLRIGRKRQPGGSADQNRFLRRARVGLTDEVLHEVSGQPVLLREVAAELGGDDPRVVSAAIERLGIEVTSDEQAEALGKAIRALNDAQPPESPLDSKFVEGAEQFQQFDEKGFDVGAIRNWAAEALTSRDVRELGAALEGASPGDEVLRDFRDYFRAGVDTNLARSRGKRYAWMVLSVITLSTVAVTINASAVIISLPAIFRGVRLDPLRCRPRELPALDAAGVSNAGRDVVRYHETPRRRLWPRPHIQPGLRRVRAGCAGPPGRPLPRSRRGALADRLAVRAGRQRRHADREYSRDHHRRRQPRPMAGHGDASHRAGRPGRPGRRADPGRPPGRRELAPGICPVRADRDRRGRLVLLGPA